MATKAKRKYKSKNDQEEMLKAIYDSLGDNENTFLGHRFPDEDEVDVKSDSSDDNDDYDQDNERDDGYEMKEEYKIEVDSNYNNDVIPEEASTSGEGKKKKNNRQNSKNDEADNVQKEPARKQKFNNLDLLMNENNYLDIHVQPKIVFRYQDAKKL